MINYLINGELCLLQRNALMLVAFYACVLLAIMIDLCVGVSRAKRLGIMRTSYGFRRTIKKMTSYYALLIMLTLCDVIASIYLPLPFFTAVGSLGIVLVEGVSVYENRKDVDKEIEDIPKILLEVYKNRDNIAELIEHLKKYNNEKKDTTGLLE